MSFQARYCRVLDRQLNRHAVWEPGIALRLGDDGALHEGAFLRLGRVGDFLGKHGMAVAQGRPARSAFTSVGATTALLHGGAAAGPADAGAIMKRPQARVRQWASSASLSLPWAWLSGPYTGSPVRS